MVDPKKKALGRGLGALITPGGYPMDRPSPATGAAAPAPRSVPAPQSLADGSRLIELDPQKIQPNPKQPRLHFDEDALLELAESIRRDGLQEPIIVRERNGEYQLVSGERRVRASILAERPTIPAVCRDISDKEMLKLGLIENIQREDLNPIELAKAYEALIQQFKWTQEELSQQVGKKRATVTNTLRLLNLPTDVQRHVIQGDISMGHARALLALDSPLKQSAACRSIIQDGMSVRQVEKMAVPRKTFSTVESKGKDPHVARIEDELRRRFGTRVQLRNSPENKGRIEIEFFNLDDLERILALLRP